MSFGNKDLDRAYDRWKTQSKEEYFGLEIPNDYDDSLIEEDFFVKNEKVESCPICHDKESYCYYCREEMNKKLTCPRCQHDQMKKSRNWWTCKKCKHSFSSDQLFKREPISLDEVNIDKINELKIAGRNYEATKLMEAYKLRQESERKKERKEYQIQRNTDRKERLKALGICIVCGKNHTTNNKVKCDYCCNREKTKYKENKRQKNMTEQKETKKEAVVVPFIRSNKESIPEAITQSSSKFVQQAMKEMGYMATGDVLRIPIGQTTIEENVQVTKKRYAYACREANKKITGDFKVYERGTDVYVERLA